MAEATTHSSYFFFVAKGKSGLAATATATSTSSSSSSFSQICSNHPFFSQNLRVNRTIRSNFQSIEELGNQRCLRNWQKNGNFIQQLFSANADDGGRCQQNRPLERLPLLVHEGSLRSQYAWDGQCLRTVKLEAAKPGRAQFGRWAVDWEEFVSKLMQALRNIFIPEHVRPNYVPYMRWKFLHRVLSSILHVQSTQAMLRAIGVGAQRALPSAAALNWVLKDGLGRFGKLVYAASLGQTFDSDIKRVRFTTSMLFSISLGLEMLTPFFPHHFLLIATLANVGKSISFAAYVSTSSAILKSFALGDNLADIAAKGQVQAVVSDNLGLAIAVAISRIYKFFPRLESTLPIWIFPFLSVFELFAIFNELQSVHLLTLNKVRLEVIIDTWLLEGTVPSAEEVSKYESRSLLIGAVSGGKLMNLRIGALNPISLKRDELMALLNQQKDQQHLLLQDCEHYPFWHSPLSCTKIGLRLWLNDKASSIDIIKGVLQASYIRTVLKPNSLHTKDSMLFNAQNQSAAVHVERSATVKEGNVSLLDGEFMNWVEQSRQFAEENVQSLLTEMKKGGWHVTHILLKPHERCTYSIPDT